MPRVPRKVATPAAPDLGQLGEQWVAQWLQRRGWRLLAQRWHCRWGELDLVMGRAIAPGDPTDAADQSDQWPQAEQAEQAEQYAAIAFVEVKTRRDRGWDEAGKLAITPQKQAKLWKAAELFLAEHPQWAEVPCGFDVALVQGVKLAGAVDVSQIDGETTVIAQGYRLTLVEYLQNAFTII